MSISVIIPSKEYKLEQCQSLGQYLVQLKSLPKRKIAFFDESISVVVILRRLAVEPGCGDRSSEVFLDVSLAPGACGDPRDELEEEQANIKFMSQTLSVGEMLFEGAYDDEFYTIWQVETPITYPKRKLSNPSIVFECFLKTESGTRRADGELVGVNHGDSPLEAYRARFRENLFEQLNSRIAEDDLTYLLRVESPKGETFDKNDPVYEPVYSLKDSVYIPVSASLVVKLKSTKPAGRNNILLATLNLELSEELIKLVDGDSNYDLSIEDISVNFANGKLERLDSLGGSFPISCKLYDSFSMTYKLVNNKFYDNKNSDKNPQNYSSSIDMKLRLRVRKLLEGLSEYENISNIITINWSPFLDFKLTAPPINNALKTSSSYTNLSSLANLQPFKSIRKNNFYKAKMAPSTPSLGNGSPLTTGQVAFNVNNPKRLQKLPFHSSSSLSVNLTTNNSSTLSGLRLTFKGNLTIKLGEVVTWKLQAINASPFRLNLSLIMQSPMASNPSKRATFNKFLINTPSQTKEINNPVVLDKSQLFNAYQALKLSYSGLVILDNDIRMGPLEPNSVFETSLRFLGVAPGIYNLDGIKVFDVGSGDGLDFGKLVEVYVV